MQKINVRALLQTIWHSKNNRYLLLILFGAALHFVTAIHWGLPQASSAETVAPWPVDVIAPVGPLTEAHKRFKRDTSGWVVYPLFHYIVLDVVYAPYVVLQYLRGEMQQPSSTFPYGVTTPSIFFRDLTLIARLVSLFMALGIIVAIYAITREVFSERAALWSALFSALIAPFGFYAKTSNLDVPYLFWTMLAIWQCLQAIQHHKLKNYILFGAFGALAIATKDQAYGYFVFTPFIFATYIAMQKHGKLLLEICKAFYSKPIIVTGISTVLFFALGNNLLFGGWEGYLKHLEFAQTLHEQKVVGDNPNLYGLQWQLQLLTNSILMLIEMLSLPALLIAAAGCILAIVKKNHLAMILMLLCLGYYLAVIGLVGVTYSRYLLGIAILLTPFIGYIIDYCLQRKVIHNGLVMAGAALCLLWQLALCANLNYLLLNDSRYRMADWINKNLPTDAVIESSTQIRYLPRITGDRQYQIVANTHSAVDYNLQFDALTQNSLQQRKPDYILVLSDIKITGDPEEQDSPAAQKYYRELLNGDYGYRTVAHFSTPNMLPYKQITAGTGPTSILLKKIADNTAF